MFQDKCNIYYNVDFIYGTEQLVALKIIYSLHIIIYIKSCEKYI